MSTRKVKVLTQGHFYRKICGVGEVSLTFKQEVLGGAHSVSNITEGTTGRGLQGLPGVFLSSVQGGQKALSLDPNAKHPWTQTSVTVGVDAECCIGEKAPGWLGVSLMGEELAWPVKAVRHVLSVPPDRSPGYSSPSLLGGLRRPGTSRLHPTGGPSYLAALPLKMAAMRTTRDVRG